MTSAKPQNIFKNTSKSFEASEIGSTITEAGFLLNEFENHIDNLIAWASGESDNIKDKKKEHDENNSKKWFFQNKKNMEWGRGKDNVLFEVMRYEIKNGNVNVINSSKQIGENITDSQQNTNTSFDFFPSMKECCSRYSTSLVDGAMRINELKMQKKTKLDILFQKNNNFDLHESKVESYKTKLLQDNVIINDEAAIKKKIDALENSESTWIDSLVNFFNVPNQFDEGFYVKDDSEKKEDDLKKEN